MRSLAPDSVPGPSQQWRDPEKALTEFDTKPFLAIRYEHRLDSSEGLLVYPFYLEH